MGKVSYAVTLSDPLAVTESKYALVSKDGYFNLRGDNEKYLLSTNGSNSAGANYYFLTPAGLLYAYTPDSQNDLLASFGTAPVATFEPSVYANPALLTTNTGSPIVTASLSALYDLKVQLGLSTPVISSAYNLRQADEQYLKSSNGSNSTNGGYFVLMPDNKLYAWNGSLAANQLIADFNTAPYSVNAYVNPALLTGASLSIAPGISTSIDDSSATLTLTPAAGFDRNVQVAVTATDSQSTYTSTFTYQVNDTPPSIPTVSADSISHGAAPPIIPLGASGNGTLTYSATVSGYSPLYDLHQQFGLTTPDRAFNLRQQNEKYLFSGNASNPAGGGYYVLMPTDKLYAYIPDSSNDLNATLANAPVANFTSAAYNGVGNVYNEPALLYNASAPAIPTAASDRGQYYDVQTQLGLTSSDITSAYNLRGENEKYLRSTNGSNSAGSGYYVLTLGEKLYAYVQDAANDLVATLANPAVADFSNVGPVYFEPNLLYAARPAAVSDPLFDLKQSLGLTTADRYYNYRHQGEKYLLSSNGRNTAGANYYVLMPGDQLYAYVQDAKNDLAATLSQTPIADFTQQPYASFLAGGNVYNTPALLYASTGQSAAMTATVDSNGNVTVTPNTSFVGTAKITVLAFDGAEFTSQSFLFTVVDTTPTLQTISNINGSSSVGSTTVNFNAGTFNNVTVRPSASVTGYNPYFDFKSLYGLNSPASYYNHRGRGELYFLSSNGCNPSGYGYYVLMPNDDLYSYVQDANNDLTATLSHTPVANFATAPYTAFGNAYANPAILYNATEPEAPAIAASFPSLNSLQLQWPGGFKGTFSVTLTIGDGALETQQTFQVNVS